jgi:hypothetical protein
MSNNLKENSAYITKTSREIETIERNRNENIHLIYLNATSEEGERNSDN